MKFIALKTCDGGAKGRISFCRKALKVTRQEFHEYLKNRNKPWKHEELAAKMMEILHEDECNDTYGRERMHKALLLKYPDSGIPSFFTFVKEYSIYLASVILGVAARSPLRKEKLILRNNVTGVDVFGANNHYSSGKVGNIALVNIDIAIQIFICNFFDFIFVIIYVSLHIFVIVVPEIISILFSHICDYAFHA